MNVKVFRVTVRTTRRREIVYVRVLSEREIPARVGMLVGDAVVECSWQLVI